MKGALSSHRRAGARVPLPPSACPPGGTPPPPTTSPHRRTLPTTTTTTTITTTHCTTTLASRAVAALTASLLAFSPLTPPPPALARASLTPEEKNAIHVFEEARPSVVFITTLRSGGGPMGALQSSAIDVPDGEGSGFLWDSEGHVVTNLHVVRSAPVVQVTLRSIYITFQL